MIYFIPILQQIILHENDTVAFFTFSFDTAITAQITNTGKITVTVKNENQARLKMSPYN